jgi:chromosome segregation ATPase
MYQKAQGTMARLQQRIEAQEYELQEQTHRLQSLEEELAQSKAQQAHVSQIDEQLVYFKEELLQTIERRYGRQQSTTPDTGSSLMRQQLDNQTQTLRELRREIDRMRRYDDQISLARAETTRLNQAVHQFQANLDELSNQLDERVRPLSYIEEQRRIQTRSLSELQAELPELHKKIETCLTKIQLVEQQAPQFAKYEAALDSIREEIRRHRERMDFQSAERERQLKSWTELVETTRHRMRENETMLEKYAEHYQLNKRALASLQDFQESLQREQHRFGELQRLAEERHRAELEKFQAGHEQRWQKQTMELQPQLGDFQKNLEAVQQRLDGMAKLNQMLEDQMNMVLQIIEEDIQARASAVTDWQARFETLANGQA